jgi:hypothetical protein
MVEAYKAKLKEIINEGLIGFQSSPKWTELNDLITEEVLQDAFESGKRIHYDGLDIVRRDLKSMERIAVKKAMVRPDNGFKTNCDLMAFRVLTKNVCDIPSLTDTVLKENIFVGNRVHIREPLVTELNGSVSDIVQYMYVYHTDVGYLAEYQICHPFAALKFKHDSGVRDGKPGFLEFSKAKVHVYKTVKNYLLHPGSDFNLVELWQEAFGEKPSQEWLDCFDTT